MIVTDEQIRQLDTEFSKAGVPFRDRPQEAIRRLFGPKTFSGFERRPEVEQVYSAYRRLVPEVAEVWRGLGIGFARSLDRIRKFAVPVIFGAPRITVHSALGFASHHEWVEWCRNDSNIAAQSCYQMADAFDFSYGTYECRGINTDADELWKMAASNLADLTNVMVVGAASPSVTQPICLTAELAMKGALRTLGVPNTQIANKRLGHNHLELARLLTAKKGHRDDALLLKIASEFPNYVESRYRDPELSRLQMVDLAAGAQFVAATSLRRVCDRDFGAAFAGDWPGSRLAI